MQNSSLGAGSPLPGNSSRTSTSASQVFSQENGDELESYLSIVAGKGGDRQKQKAVVDWGRLLDSHGGEYHSDQGEGEHDVHRIMEPDEAEDAIVFLKTQAQPQTEPGRSKCTGIDSTNNAPGVNKLSSQPNSLKDLSRKKFGLNTSLVGSHMDIDITDSITLTDTTATEESWSENATNLLADTPTPSCNKRADRNESICLGGPDEHSETAHVDSRKISASRRSLSPVLSEEDSSDLSLSQNLFRNNLFTVDQLVAPSAISTPDENNSSKEINVSPLESAQMYEIQSLADLESLPAEGKIGLQSTAKEHHMSPPGMHQTGAEDKAAEESFSFNGRQDHHTSVVDTEEGTKSSSVSYEEDFESDTVESNGSTHDLEDTAISLQAPAGKESSDNKSDSSQWEQSHADSTDSSPQSRRKHHNTIHATTDTTVHVTTDSDSKTRTCESGTMTEESYLRGTCMYTHMHAYMPQS